MIKQQALSIHDYSYDLPHDRIAEQPLPERDASRLLVYREGVIQDDYFFHLPQHLPEGSTLVLNNTRVIEARLFFQKPSGGVIELFCLEPWEQVMEISLAQQGQVVWKCLIGGASKWKPGQVLEKQLEIKGEGILFTATYVRKETDSFLIHFSWSPSHYSFAELLHAAGAIPLPPYIKRPATEKDKDRYQTIFSRQEGSVAAPTAALHFTDTVFQNLAKKNIHPAYLTLHVGAGTFKPVKAATMEGHYMHAEPFTVSKEFLENILHANKIIVTGTTSLRTLESLHWLGLKLMKTEAVDNWKLEQWEAYYLEEKYGRIDYHETIGALIKWMEENSQAELHCQTSLIIAPGYSFLIPDALITNFHQPQSTLLLLVAAFIGDDWKKIYTHALENNYRFLSYGDSSLLWRKTIPSIT
jgi:S-adenosylmethionine:tRNA ribosyltransferase-isomerase